MPGTRYTTGYVLMSCGDAGCWVTAIDGTPRGRQLSNARQHVRSRRQLPHELQDLALGPVNRALRPDRLPLEALIPPRELRRRGLAVAAAMQRRQHLRLVDADDAVGTGGRARVELERG